MNKRTDSLHTIVPLLQKYGATCSASEFQSAINLAFHAAEAKVYDDVHIAMQLSLPHQFDLITDDCLRAGAPAELNLLDVGCGTGLSTEMFLRTALGRRTKSILMVDTSEEMLTRAHARSLNWSVPATVARTTIEELAGHFNAILACSVLHHIPDIEKFMSSLRTKQTAGDIFIHLHDLNGDHRDDPEQKARVASLPPSRRPPRWKWALKKVLPSFLASTLRKQDYIDAANATLLASKVISRPMSDEDLWRVTDIHVYDEGTSVREIAQLLPSYEMCGLRTYSFFGKLRSELPGNFQAKEDALVNERALNGVHLSAAWKRQHWC